MDTNPSSETATKFHWPLVAVQLAEKIGVTPTEAYKLLTDKRFKLK